MSYIVKNTPEFGVVINEPGWGRRGAVYYLQYLKQYDNVLLLTPEDFDVEQLRSQIKK